ncbi:hypothetical protein GAYE_SCF15G3576 [Galdieria yellowstonensis]|uniref:Uncharacterized protein n=1 Tax=Galdieria yellowstonensis TaxID=3028027 RepID=A0AAV9IE53_9RHOD|nr:hypothetical protein GAYE_SCF15G3576 [Galdieria yellowstonensis]
MDDDTSCEQTWIEGFFIEAFSSLEEAQRYHYQQQQRVQENKKEDGYAQNIYGMIHGNNGKEIAMITSSKDSPIRMPENSVHNEEWKMNCKDVSRTISSSHDHANDTRDKWGGVFGRQWSHQNGMTDDNWTESGKIQVPGRNQVHSFIVDHRNVLAFRKKTTSESRSSHRHYSMNPTNDQNCFTSHDDELTTSPGIPYPYTTSTLKQKTSFAPWDTCHTMSSSDNTSVSENWFKATDNGNRFQASPLTRSYSAMSPKSHLNHPWNHHSSYEATQSNNNTNPRFEVGSFTSSPRETSGKIVVQRCENCGREHYGGFASGRFCSSKCARTIGGNARKRQRLEAQGIRFDDNGKPLDPIPKRLRYTPKHNVHREGDKPGKGYRLCIHCNQPTPNRKIRCQYCGEENPNAVRARNLIESQRKAKTQPTTIDSTIPHDASIPSTWIYAVSQVKSVDPTPQGTSTHSETEEEEDEMEIQKEETQNKKQIGFLLNPS